MGYAMRLVRQDIYDLKDPGEARKLFRNWCVWLQPMQGQTGEMLKPMVRAARLVKGHLEGILAH